MSILVDASMEALTDMPPRAEYELDAVTLHNQALINFEQNPTEGFEKLQFLLQQNPFPPETFANILLLYCKHECYDLAAEILAENVHLTYKYLSSVSMKHSNFNLVILSYFVILSYLYVRNEHWHYIEHFQNASGN